MIEAKINQVLKNLEKRETFERENPSQIHNSQKMLAVTRNIGLFYNILLRGINAKKILEIGTSTGYSTIWFAEAIKTIKDGKIITIEKDEKKISRAKQNFEDAGISSLIEIQKGDAIDVLSKIHDEPNTKESFDFVFIDADKERYIQYFDMVLPLVKIGGFIGADNIVWPERFVDFIKPYLKHVRNNSKVRSVTVPIDNGEEISIKISS